MTEYTPTEKRIAAIVWQAWSKLEDVPSRSNQEVLAAVRASAYGNLRDYDRMRAAMRLLGWLE